MADDMSNNVEESSDEESQEDDSEKTVYELGYHLLSSITEEDIPTHVSDIKGIIEKNGGVFISEELPRKTPLAYAISKQIGREKHVFDDAYFGWIKFETEALKVSAFKTELDSVKEMLRYIIVKTSRETMHPIKRTYSARPSIGMRGGASSGRREKETPTISEEELDRTIEELVVE
jgi:ribosomal protein S6|tara:strand:- start:29651 stop:30178 length:528 start_codon:yes stop_codon:yes gene_type:complete